MAQVGREQSRSGNRPNRSGKSKVKCRLCRLAQGESEQRLLLQFVSLGRTSSRSRVGSTLDASQLRAKDPLQARRDKRERAHVGRLFLHPDKFAGIVVTAQDVTDLVFGKGIHLLE